jgi:hypothetical protein
MSSLDAMVEAADTGQASVQEHITSLTARLQGAQGALEEATQVGPQSSQVQKQFYPVDPINLWSFVNVRNCLRKLPR